MTTGNRESHWHVLRRCLAIVRRLQRGPASREQLIAGVLAWEGARAYGNTQGKVLAKRIDNDLRRIREHLMIDIRYDRKSGRYELVDLWRPLLDLADDDLATLAWLEEEFGLESPQHDQVHALIERLRFFLGMQRSADIERQRSSLTLGLVQRDEHEFSEEEWTRLQEALNRRCQVEFLYGSPQQADAIPRRHVVEFYKEPTFEEGHYYIRGYCRYTDGPMGRYDLRRYFNYRLDRISDMTVLATKLPPYPPRPQTYEVVYELSPEVARKGVSRPRWMTGVTVEQRPDGSAVVRGETEDLFRTLQALMRYREHCRVLGGQELLGGMQETVRKMGELYEDDT